MVGTIVKEKNKEKKLVWQYQTALDNIKHTNIWIIGVLEEEEKESEKISVEIIVRTSLTWERK